MAQSGPTRPATPVEVTTRKSAPASSSPAAASSRAGPNGAEPRARDHGVEVAGRVEPEPQPVEQQRAAAGPVDGIGDEHADVQRAARGVGPRQEVGGRDETEDDRCDLPSILGLQVGDARRRHLTKGAPRATG